MFEVTILRLEALAAVDLVISTALVSKAAPETVLTLGLDSHDLIAASASLVAATEAVVFLAGSMVALEALRASMVTDMIAVGGLSAESAGESAATTAAAAATA